MLLSCQDVKSREKSDLSDADVKLWQINTLLQCSYSCPGCSSALDEVVIQISNCSLDLHFTHKRFPGGENDNKSKMGYSLWASFPFITGV